MYKPEVTEDEGVSSFVVMVHEENLSFFDLYQWMLVCTILTEHYYDIK